MAKKETVTLEHIKQDLMQVATSNFRNLAEWRFSYIVPFTLIVITFGFGSYIALEFIWIAFLFFLIDGYHLVRYLIVLKNYIAQKNTISKISKREGISISVERLSHISKEMIYEPHRSVLGSRAYATKEIALLNFISGRRWRIIDCCRLYEWSEDYYMSGYGIEKASVKDDEFVYVSLQSNQNINCVYPCDYFKLDEELEK